MDYQFHSMMFVLIGNSRDSNASIEKLLCIPVDFLAQIHVSHR